MRMNCEDLKIDTYIKALEEILKEKMSKQEYAKMLEERLNTITGNEIIEGE